MSTTTGESAQYGLVISQTSDSGRLFGGPMGASGSGSNGDSNDNTDPGSDGGP